jgi:hypothetical protein
MKPDMANCCCSFSFISTAAAATVAAVAAAIAFVICLTFTAATIAAAAADLAIAAAVIATSHCQADCWMIRGCLQQHLQGAHELLSFTATAMLATCQQQSRIHVSHTRSFRICAERIIKMPAKAECIHFVASKV